ncbi:hypothetical protein D3C76_795480 [compost metagenome]
MRDQLILLPGWALGSAPLGWMSWTTTFPTMRGLPVGRWAACSPPNWQHAVAKPAAG